MAKIYQFKKRDAWIDQMKKDSKDPLIVAMQIRKYQIMAENKFLTEYEMNELVKKLKEDK